MADIDVAVAAGSDVGGIGDGVNGMDVGVGTEVKAHPLTKTVRKTSKRTDKIDFFIDFLLERFFDCAISGLTNYLSLEFVCNQNFFGHGHLRLRCKCRCYAESHGFFKKNPCQSVESVKLVLSLSKYPCTGFGLFAPNQPWFLSFRANQNEL